MWRWGAREGPAHTAVFSRSLSLPHGELFWVVAWNSSDAGTSCRCQQDSAGCAEPPQDPLPHLSVSFCWSQPQGHGDSHLVLQSCLCRAGLFPPRCFPFCPLPFNRLLFCSLPTLSKRWEKVRVFRCSERSWRRGEWSNRGVHAFQPGRQLAALSGH